MKEIAGINHIGIRVSDLQQARVFYEQLGFEFIAGPDGAGTCCDYGASLPALHINFILNADTDNHAGIS